MRSPFISVLFAVFAIALGAQAQTPDPLPPAYVPQQQVSGLIRIWGHGSYDPQTDFIEALVRSWETGFQRHQPDVTFENRLNGTAAAIGALYTGVGDLALMGREIWPNEISGFEEVRHYPPTGVDIVTGSFNVRNHGYATVVFVHKDNPLTGLTLKQLDAVFSADHRRGDRAARTWGDLGLTGAWKERPIHVYGLPIARGLVAYLEDVIFAGSHKWNPDIREFADLPGSKGGATDGGQMMLEAMAKDPDGIGFAGLPYHHPDMKAIAIATEDGGAYVPPTRETVLDHSYPLTRIITMFLDRQPGQPVDPKLKEFLRYILSREAQEAVVREGGGYLPMIAPFAETEIKKLE